MQTLLSCVKKLIDDPFAKLKMGNVSKRSSAATLKDF